MELDQKTLGNRLKTARESCGYTQDDVEEQTGINRTTLSKIESGTLSVSSLKLRKLARLYGVSITNLLRDVDEPEEHPDFILATRKKAPDTPEARRDIRKIEQFCENYTRLFQLREENGS